MAAITRRDALAAGARGARSGSGWTASRPDAAGGAPPRVVTKGRLKQSVSRWCYQRIPMPDFCKAVAAMGLTAVDLLQPQRVGAGRAVRADLLAGLRGRRHHPQGPQR